MDGTVEEAEREASVFSDIVPAAIFDIFKSPANYQPKTVHTPRRTPKRKINEVGVCESEGKSEKSKSRTPSGQVLTNSVESIRSFFQSKTEVPPFQCVTQESISSTFKANITPGSQKCPSAISTSAVDCGTVNKQTETSISAESVSVDANWNTDVLIAYQALKDQLFKCDISEQTMSQLASIDKTMKELQSSSTSTKVQMESQDLTNTNPASIDLRTVMQMLQDLRKDILDKPQAQMPTNNQVSNIEKRVSRCETMERIMINSMARLSDLIEELQNKSETLELNNAKRMVVLSGFSGSNKKHIFRRQLEDFFSTNMDISVPIEDHYFVGQKPIKDVVLILPSICEKRQIFQNVSKLKGIVNQDGEKFFFRDYKIQKTTELQKKMQHIISEMDKLDTVDQEDVELIQGRIHVGDGIYQRQISPPDPTKVLQLSMDELDQIMGIKLDKGDVCVVKNNQFVGYSMCTDNYEAINDAYMKIRLTHADARHIVCAWNIPGIRRYECIDYCDDADHGCGAVISKVMTDNKITHRVIFIVRKCGMKLNQDRFSTYTEVAYKLLEKYPMNHLTGKSQTVHPPTQDEDAKLTYAGALSRPRSGNKRHNQRGSKKYQRTNPNTKYKKQQSTEKKTVYSPPNEDVMQANTNMEWNDENDGN